MLKKISKIVSSWTENRVLKFLCYIFFISHADILTTTEEIKKIA